MSYRLYLWFAFSLVLGGCAMPEYVKYSPPSGPSANVTFMTKSLPVSSSVTVLQIDKTSCSDRLKFVDIGKMSNGGLLGGGESFEVPVNLVAEEDIQLLLRHYYYDYTTTASCDVPGSFRFESGRKYKIEFVLERKGCHADAVMLNEGNPIPIKAGPITVAACL